MVDILPLGPFPANDTAFYTASAIGPRGPCVADGASVTAAVAGVLKRLPGPRDPQIFLPPWLASEAKAAGAKTREPPQELVLFAAISALGMQSEPPVKALGDYWLTLALAMFDFVRAEPWAWIHDDDPIELDVGGRRHTVSVLGMGGEIYGLLVYRGKVRPGEIAARDAFGLVLEKEPQLLARALRTLDVDWVPMFFAVTRGVHDKMTVAEVETLVAALAVTSQMAREKTARGQAAIAGLLGPLEARAQLGAEGPEMRFVEQDEPRARSPAKVGRNEPCPCGSGQKYKKCCLDKARAPARASEHELDRRLLDQVEAFTAATWPKLLPEKLAACPLAHDDDAMAQLGRTWVLCHAVAPDGRTPLRAFLDARRDRLSAEERAWAEAQSSAHLSLFEVISVEAGAHLVLRDRLTREEHRVHDVLASQSATPGVSLVGRVANVGGKALLAGTLPRLLRPTQAEPVRAAIERRLKKAGISRTATGLHAEAAGRIVLEVASAELEDHDRAASAPPRMEGGSEIEQVKDVFEVTDPERARRQLDAHPDLRSEAPGEWIRVGPRIETTVFRPREGILTLAGKRLTVETLSRAHADRLRIEIEAALGAIATHRVRSHEDPKLEVPAGQIRLQALIADIAPSMEFIRREQDRLWLGQSVPALDGRTPREAAGDARGRKKLDLLLKERAVMEASVQATPPGLDLRAVLGVSEGGRRMTPKTQMPRLPKLSEALLDWFGAVSPWTADDARAPDSAIRFEQRAGAAVKLWNCTLPGLARDDRDRVVEALAADGPWDGAAIERLIARRTRLFGEDERRVERVETRCSGGEPALVVAFSYARR